MKTRIKILLTITTLITTLFVSCASMNKVYINDYNEQMELVRDNFPEFYNLYKQGRVKIYDVYKYTDKKTGKERVGVNYSYL